jgi:hypothetical protein
MFSKEENEYVDKIKENLLKDICENGLCNKKGKFHTTCGTCQRQLKLCKEHDQETNAIGECWYCTKGI